MTVPAFFCVRNLQAFARYVFPLLVDNHYYGFRENFSGKGEWQQAKLTGYGSANRNTTSLRQNRMTFRNCCSGFRTRRLSYMSLAILTRCICRRSLLLAAAIQPVAVGKTRTNLQSISADRVFVSSVALRKVSIPRHMRVRSMPTR